MRDMMTQEEAMNMSNEQAIQILIPMRNMMYDQNGCPISDAVFALDKAIEALSTDEPQGEWIEVDDYFIRCKCSICGWESHKYEDDVYGMPYCPNCGARMKGTDDEISRSY